MAVEKSYQLRDCAHRETMQTEMLEVSPCDILEHS